LGEIDLAIMPTKTIDTILEDFSIKEVDFLKVDMEGAEKEIFSNPRNWVNKIKSIKMEIHPPATFEWCFSVLEKNGFKCTKDTIHRSANVGIKN